MGHCHSKMVTNRKYIFSKFPDNLDYYERWEEQLKNAILRI